MRICITHIIRILSNKSLFRFNNETNINIQRLLDMTEEDFILACDTIRIIQRPKK